jgi:hypothetical protein
MRDKNILLSYKREINLNTKIKKSKKSYSRKLKHKRTYFEKEYLCY